MAGDWIKMRCELGHDPDVIQIGAILGIDEFAVVGRLHAVWSWLDQHSETGTNVRIVTAYLDRLVACPGFAEAMRTVGWLSGRDGNLTFPGYESHNGETAKHRASETKRKQKQRNKCPAENGTNVPQKTGPEKRREEKNRGGEEKAPTYPGLADFDDEFPTSTAVEFDRIQKQINRMSPRWRTAFTRAELETLHSNRRIFFDFTDADWSLLEAYMHAVIPEDFGKAYQPNNRGRFMEHISDIVSHADRWKTYCRKNKIPTGLEKTSSTPAA